MYYADQGHGVINSELNSTKPHSMCKITENSEICYTNPSLGIMDLEQKIEDNSDDNCVRQPRRYSIKP